MARQSLQLSGTRSHGFRVRSSQVTDFKRSPHERSTGRHSELVTRLPEFGCDNEARGRGPAIYQSHRDGLESSQGREEPAKKTTTSSPKAGKPTYRSTPPRVAVGLQEIPGPNSQNLWLRRHHHRSCGHAVLLHALKSDNRLGGPDPGTRAREAEGFLLRAEIWSETVKALWPVARWRDLTSRKAAGFKEPRQAPRWQLARNQGPKAYNGKELNSTQNRSKSARGPCAPARQPGRAIPTRHTEPARR